MTIISNNFHYHRVKLVVLFLMMIVMIPAIYCAINVSDEEFTFFDFIREYFAGIVFPFYYIYAQVNESKQIDQELTESSNYRMKL